MLLASGTLLALARKDSALFRDKFFLGQRASIAESSQALQGGESIIHLGRLIAADA